MMCKQSCISPFVQWTTVKFIKWLSWMYWNPSRLGGLHWPSIKQGGSRHQDSSSRISLRTTTMTSSEAPHQISMKSKLLAKDKMICWWGLGCVWITILLTKLLLWERIICRDICGLFMWNYINLLYCIKSPTFSLYSHWNSPLMPISMIGAKCYRRVLSAQPNRYW